MLRVSECEENRESTLVLIQAVLTDTLTVSIMTTCTFFFPAYTKINRQMKALLTHRGGINIDMKTVSAKYASRLPEKKLPLYKSVEEARQIV